MLLRLPATPRQLRWQLAGLLGAVATIAGALAWPAVYVLSTRHVEQAALEQLRVSLTSLESALAHRLGDAPTAEDHAALEGLLDRAHFVGIRWRDSRGAVTAELWAAGLAQSDVRAAKEARPRMGGTLLRYRSEAFVLSKHPAGSGTAEALYRLSPETVHALDGLVQGASLVAVAAVLATTLTLYPVLLGLIRRALGLSEQLLRSNLDLMRGLGSAIALRDADTDTHNYRVTLYAVRLAEAIPIPHGEISDLIAGAFLHDIGKIGIPDAVLLKRGPLSASERLTIEQHPLLGDELIAHSRWLARARPIVRHHHERYDGNGYPDGLMADAIPLQARLFTIVDVFDALTSERPYKPALDLPAALGIMRGEKGRFDERLLRVFDQLAERLYSEIGRAGQMDLHTSLERALTRYYPLLDDAGTRGADSRPAAGRSASPNTSV